MKTDIIQFYTKNIYGKPTWYYQEEEIAELMIRLTGKKTMTPQIQTALQDLGFAFVEVLPPKE